MPTRAPLSVASNWKNDLSRWEWYFGLLLLGLLLFLPYSLGVVEAWSELVVVCVASLLVIGLTVRVWCDRSFSLTRSWTYLPLLAVLALIAFQLLPLPTAVVSSLSPHSVELRQELLGAQAQQSLGGSAEASMTLSLSPYATAHGFRMALLFAALFVTTASVFRTCRQIEWALLALFLVGCAEAGIALLQILTLSTKIHWLYAEQIGVVTSGSFVNYSHFCQFVNLALGAGVALLLVRMKADSRRGRGGASRWADLRGERYLRPLAGILLCAVAIFTSMSRNGGISLLLAAVVIGVLLYRRGVLSTRGWLMGMVPLGVVVVLFLTCFDAVYDRFATLEENSYFVGGRLELTAGVLRAWQDFSVWGAGLGTHEYIFPLYDSAVMPSMAEHADNDWAQLLEEFGLVGAGAVLVFVLGIFGVAGKLMFRGQTTLSTAAFGLSLGLLATAWHSLSDFGQHLPGVFSLTAVISGLLVAIARYERSESGHGQADKVTTNTNQRLRYPLIAVASAGVLLGCWWVGAGAVAAYRGEAWHSVVYGIEQRMQAGDWEPSDQTYSDLLMAAQLAAEAEPANVKSGHLLSLYRWRSMSRNRDPQTGNILLDPEMVPFVARIADELAQLRLICPFYGPLYSLEGELRLQVLGEPIGARLIDQAAKLMPFDASVCLLAGRLRAQEGDIEKAVVLLNRAVSLQPSQFVVVAKIYLVDLKRADLAQSLAQEDHGRIVQLAQLVEAEVSKASGGDAGEQSPSGYPQLAQELRARALVLLRQRIAAGKATAGELAQLAGVEWSQGRPAAAIGLYRKALGRQYSQTVWRLSLARALLESGQADQALREARIVLRLKPRSQAAINLINQISVLPVSPPSTPVE